MATPEASHGVATWLASRAGDWREIARRGERADRKTLAPEEALQLSADYRLVARDLASARHHLPGRPATRALESLYFNLHALHRPARSTLGEALKHFFVEAVPASFRRVRPLLVWIVGWFVLCAGAGWWLIDWQPELVALFLPEHSISGVEAGQVWTDQVFGVTPPGLESVAILSNNVIVALTALVCGLLLGLGTLYLLGLNGLMLGAALSFTHQHGLAGNLGQFIIAHGFVELSVICLSAAAGTYIGDALVRPGGRSRAVALHESVREVTPLIGLCCLLLVGCGFIEGYLSPDPSFPMPSRLVVGVCWWLVMVGLLVGPRKPASDTLT